MEMDSLTHWSMEATLTPYLDTPSTISSSPGTNGSFPSCYERNTTDTLCTYVTC
jgi:hypothetical protein